LEIGVAKRERGETMTLETIRAALGWCTIINWGFLFFWAVFLRAGHDFVYNIHNKWVPVPAAEFDSIHYKGMACYKTGIILFNLAPYLALRIVG
jgi:hypothetical protein